ncbi:MAG: integrase [Actinomyces sp.]|nr:MAG: integrase [Actinomyces sp.]
MVYPTRDIALWIEVEYNQKLLHSTLGYRIANEVEGERRTTRRAA